MANHLTYLLNALLDEDDDGVPDAQQRGMRQGIPRTQGMSLGAPSADGRMDEYLGIDQPELDTSTDPGFDASPLDQFLERFSQGGVPGGMQRPQGFGQGLLSGLAQGAVGRGGRVTERRKKFEESQRLRSAERDKANLAATADYRKRVADSRSGLAKEGREEARKQREYERTMRDRLPGEKVAADRETRRQFEVDRDYGLKVRSENRQASEAAKTGSGKPPAASERDKLTDDATALTQARDLSRLYRKEFVGPFTGRAQDVATGLGTPARLAGLKLRPGEADFRGALAQYRNRVINALSGAAVSESEAKRMAQQIPQVTDPSETFEAKLRQTEKNLRNVATTRRETATSTGVDLSGLVPLPADQANPWDWLDAKGRP